MTSSHSEPVRAPASSSIRSETHALTGTKASGIPPTRHTEDSSRYKYGSAGYKHNAVPTAVGLRSNDASERHPSRDIQRGLCPEVTHRQLPARNEHMMVFMTTQDHGMNYAAT